MLAISLAVTSPAQQGPLPSKSALAAKRKIERMHQNDRLSVVSLQAQEEFGTLISCDQVGFTFYDVDSKTNATLKYSDIKVIKEGYGGYNSVRNRHTDHTKAIVISLVVVGALAGLIAAAAASK